MDLVLINGDIYTMDRQTPRASAIAIKNGIIEAIGKDEDVLGLKTEYTKVVNLQGKTVIPGLNDSHMHLLFYKYSGVNLFNTRSVSEIQDRLRKYIKDNNVKNGEWIIGLGWNEEGFRTKKAPTIHDLDEVSKTHPIIIRRKCLHTLVANSKAMEIAGITKDTVPCEGGAIGRENGELSGLLAENQMNIMNTFTTGALTLENIKSLITAAGDELAKNGITSIQTDDFQILPDYRNDIIKAYSDLAREGKLKMRVNLQCFVKDTEEMNEVLGIPQTEEPIRNFFKLGPIKITSDGSLGARTAYMKDDYNDAPGYRGEPRIGQSKLDEMVLQSHMSGRQVVVHAIGSGAMQMVFESVGKAQEIKPKTNMRHGIVHCQITDEKLLNQFKDTQMLALVQPIFLNDDCKIVINRVGESMAKTSYAFKTLLDTGVHVSLGTDCPVEDFNPMANIYCAVTRKDLSNSIEPCFSPDERLTVEEAIYGYTEEGAYASFEEDIKGSLVKGKLADMIVLSEPIFDINDFNKILDTKVLLTILNGQVIYESE